MSSNIKNKDDSKMSSTSSLEAKLSLMRTYETILERKGYKLQSTIGTGSYAKVKLVN
jgi:hypothetical protein